VHGNMQERSILEQCESEKDESMEEGKRELGCNRFVEATIWGLKKCDKETFGKKGLHRETYGM